MGKFINSEGEEVEAFTQDEIQEKIEQAKEEGKEELAEELETLKGTAAEKDKKIEELTGQLGGISDKDKNFGALRTAKEKAEQERDAANKKIEELTGTVDKKIGDLRSEFTQKEINAEIKKMCGGDAEIEKKVRFHYGRFAADPETDPVKRETNMRERLKDSYKLATGKEPEDVLTNMAGTGSGYHPPGEGGKGKLSQEIKDMATEKMGLKEDDFKRAQP